MSDPATTEGITDDLRSEAVSALSGAYSLLAIAAAAIRHLPGDHDLIATDVDRARELASFACSHLGGSE